MSIGADALLQMAETKGIDLSFHMTDIVQNSIRADAANIQVTLRLDNENLELIVADDGCGMDTATLENASNPSFTTRTTRTAGLGLPLLLRSAERCGGCVEIESRHGTGTRVRALFKPHNAHCPTMGAVSETLMLLMAGNPSVNISLTLSCNGREFRLSTGELTTLLGSIPLSHAHIAAKVGEILASNIGEVFGGQIK